MDVRVWIRWSKHLGCCSTWNSSKKIVRWLNIVLKYMYMLDSDEVIVQTWVSVLSLSSKYRQAG